MKQEDWNFLDYQALDVIYLTLAKNIVFNIMNKKTKINLIKALPNIYKNIFSSNNVYLMYHLFNLKINNSMFVVEYIKKFNMITNYMSFVKLTQNNKIKDLILLSSLLESWARTMTMMSNLL